MILVFGATGQVGMALSKRDDVTCLGRDRADFGDPAALQTLVAATEAQAVIIAAAYTAVDKAETDEDTAMAVNATAPGAIAQACAARGLPLIHISTDYVFDGAGNAPFAADHPTAPLGAYGRSKLAGEAAIRAAGGPHAILRTSWVVSAHGSNFVKTMLRLGAERDQLPIVADQIGGPTPARDIADACVAMAHALIDDPGKSGTYHFTGAPEVSWADFAREIFAQSGTDCAVVDIQTTDYPTPAKRPLNSRLDNSTTAQVFGITRPDWRAGLSDILNALGART